jgi:UrcA family protein
MSRLVEALVFSLAVLAAAPAFADPQAPAAITVRNDDLDLSSERGAARMLRRLERASEQVCGRDIADRYPSQRDEYSACRAATLQASVRRLGAREVSALHAARYGGDLVADR